MMKMPPFFINLLLSRLFTTIAMQMKMTIMCYFLYQLSHDALTLGMLGLFEALPRIAMSLPAGYLVEQMEKRKAYLFVLISFLLLSILLLISMNYFVHNIEWMKRAVYFIVFAMGIIGSLGPSSVTTIFSTIIPKEYTTKYSAISSNAWQIGSVIGPILGGFLIYQIGSTSAMYFVIGALCISIYNVWQLPKFPSLTRRTFDFQDSMSQIKEGLDFVFSHKILLWAITLDLFAVLFGGAVALLPVFSSEILHTGSLGYGYLRAATPLGSAIAMLIIAFRPIQKNTGKWLLGSIALFGVFTIFFALSTHIAVSIFCLIMIGAFDAVSVVVRGALMILETPDYIRARVTSVNSMFISSSNEIGAFESGFAAHYMGTVRSVVFGGSMTIIIVIFAFFKAKQLLQFEFSTKK